MTKKEHTIKLLLTTNQTYKEMSLEIGTTEKSIAFYAHQLRKIDKACLNHRKSTSTESIKDLLTKYKTD